LLKPLIRFPIDCFTKGWARTSWLVRFSDLWAFLSLSAIDHVAGG
jgi:hypothetical protein